MICFLVEYYNGMWKEELLKYLFLWVFVLIWIYWEIFLEVLFIFKVDLVVELNCFIGYG